MLELAGGATANLVASFETAGQYVADIEIHGTEGVLALPDPNTFDGPLRLRRGRGDWEEVEFASRGARDARGIGLHDLVESIAVGRPHRVSGDLAYHVVDVARSILGAAAAGRTIEIESSVDRPEPLPVAASLG